MSVRWRPAWRRIVYSVPARLRLPVAIVAALVVAEAAVLLMRPREPARAPSTSRREPTSARRRSRRPSDFRTGQLWLLRRAARRSSWACSCSSCARPPRACCGRAGARCWPAPRPRRRSRLAIAVATLPVRGDRARAGQGRRPGHAVLGRLGRRRRQGHGDRRPCSRAPAARCWSFGMRRFGRALVGARRPPWWSRFGVVIDLPDAVVLDPLFNKFTPLPAGRDALRRARRWRARPGVDVGQVYEVDASRRTTAANAYVTGLGHTKRVVLYDTLLKDFTPGRDAARGRPRARPRALPRRPARAAVPGARRAVRDARRRPRSASGCAARRAGTAPPCPPSRSRSALIAPAITTISNQLSRGVERRADAFALELTGEPDAMIGFEQRITLTERRATPTRRRWQQFLLGTHPTDDGADRPGAGASSASRSAGRPRSRGGS